MYYILNLVGSVPGSLKNAENWDAAITRAVEMCQEHDPTIPAEQLREELDSDGCWASNQGNVWVHILTLDGD